MIRNFRECGPQICDEDIRAVEREIGISLPQDYRDFLLAQNGGRPEPNAFPINGLENNPFGTIQVFLGIEDAIESCNLDWTYHTFSGRLPDNLIAIARDDCGDLICLSLYGEDAGSVIFWDRHQEIEEPSYANVYHVADSFAEFLESIRELPV